MKLKLIITVIITYISIVGLSAQKIARESGFWKNKYYQDNQLIERKEVVTLFKNNKEAQKLWKKSNFNHSMEFVFLGGELGFLTWEIVNLANHKNANTQVIGGLSSFVGLLVFHYLAKHQEKKAILKFNEDMDKKTTFTIEPSIKGLGLVLQF